MKIIGGRERESLTILRGACSKISEMEACCQEFLKAFFMEKNLAKAETLGKRITQLETKADADRRDFIKRLYSGAFLPALRGDLVELAEKLDKVADIIEETVGCALLREKLLLRLGRKAKEVGGRLGKIAERSGLAVKRLVEAVSLLFTDWDKTLLKVEEIQELEHESDLFGAEFRVWLSEEMENRLDALSMVQLGEISRKLGEISDAAEDAGDVLLRLISGIRG